MSEGSGGISKGNGCFGHLTALLDDPMTSSSPSANFQLASVILSEKKKKIDYSHFYSDQLNGLRFQTQDNNGLSYKQLGTSF